MSKKDKIRDLIADGKSFQEVVDGSGAAESFVKAQYTQLGMDWKEHAKEVEETEQVVKISQEPELDKDPGEEYRKKVLAKRSEPAKKPEHIDPDLKELSKLVEEYKEKLPSLPTIRRARTSKFLDAVDRFLADIGPGHYKSCNCRFMNIQPRPTASSIYKDIYEISVLLKKVYRQSRK